MRPAGRPSRLAAALALALGLSACGSSPEGARRKLADQGIAFTPTEFVRRAETDAWPTVELFLRAGMDPNIKGDTEKLENVTALMTASRAGRLETVQGLRGKGADVNAETRQGDSALIYAASTGSVEVVRELLAAGADTNHANRKGETALIAAVPAPWPGADQNRAADCVNQIIAAGARVDGRAADGRTALHAAIGRGQVGIVQLLLLRGANPNLRGGPQNVSPLRHAVAADQPQIVEALLRSGADPSEPGLFEIVADGPRTNGPAMREALRKGGVAGGSAAAR
jgi:ankyrin repeat protein